MGCNANFYLTTARRKNVLKATDPSFLQLLQDKTLFNVEDRNSLFGTTFYEAIVKSCRDDEARRRARPRGGRGGNHNSRSSRPSTSNPSSSGYHQSSSSTPSDNQPKRGFSRPQGFRYETVPSILEYEIPPVGGRIKRFLKEWRQLSQDRWVLDIIEDGFAIDFVSIPSGNTPPPPVEMSDRLVEALNLEVEALLAKRAIKEITFQHGLFWSSLFAVPKKSGGMRPIFNLRSLKRHVSTEHFQMESLDSLRYLIKPNDWFTRIDLRDAYLSIPIRESDTKFLCFQWKDRYFAFQFLPFGLSSAPRAFTKICRPIAAHFRALGIRLLVYLDDWLLIANSRDQAIRDFQYVTSFLESLGFLVNQEKSCGVPEQVVEHLGLIVDSRTMSFALPNEKISRIIWLIETALSRDLVHLRLVSSILGNLVWAIPAFPLTQAHYRLIQRFLLKETGLSLNLNRRVNLPEEVKNELIWWAQNIRLSNGRRFFIADPDIVIFADASNDGWGAVCNDIGTGGPWT